jgi:hypothetical protein
MYPPNSCFHPYFYGNLLTASSSPIHPPNSWPNPLSSPQCCFNPPISHEQSQQLPQELSSNSCTHSSCKPQLLHPSVCTVCNLRTAAPIHNALTNTMPPCNSSFLQELCNLHGSLQRNWPSLTPTPRLRTPHPSQTLFSSS